MFIYALAGLFLLNRFVISDNLGKHAYQFMSKSKLFKIKYVDLFRDIIICSNEECKPILCMKNKRWLMPSSGAIIWLC